MARSAEAINVLQPIPERGLDDETNWLLSRVYLQEGDKTRALAALKQAGSYRAANPLEAEPSPFVGEARCEKCHPAIFRDSLASRHTQTYYRGSQLAELPLPDGPLPDPDDPEVAHTFQKRDGMLREETRVGREVFDAVIDYAFGTADRYLTTVSRDTSGGYHIARLSYYQTPEGKGWDRSTLDLTHPTHAHPAGFQGDAIATQDGRARCLYCHVTNPRTGKDSLGPEMADRAIGCERCHGPEATTSPPSQPAFRTQPSSTPWAPRLRPSPSNYATTAMYSGRSSRNKNRTTRVGSARRESAGLVAAVIPKAAARLAA